MTTSIFAIYRSEVEEAAKSVANYGTLQAIFENAGAKKIPVLQTTNSRPTPDLEDTAKNHTINKKNWKHVEDLLQHRM